MKIILPITRAQALRPYGVSFLVRNLAQPHKEMVLQPKQKSSTDGDVVRVSRLEIAGFAGHGLFGADSISQSLIK